MRSAPNFFSTLALGVRLRALLVERVRRLFRHAELLTDRVERKPANAQQDDLPLMLSRRYSRLWSATSFCHS